MRRWFVALVLLLAASTAGAPLPPSPPRAGAQSLVPAPSAGPLRFAIIGDNGTGDRPQYEVARQMEAYYAKFPFEFVLMLGDNLYGRQQPIDFVNKFERPYKSFLEAGVRFFAALGNHDIPESVSYSHFNMNGERYYTFAARNARFLVLDTNRLDDKQMAWAEDVLRQAHEPWRIAYFHHPLYSNGSRHGSNVELRVRLEPMLVRNGVTVVFSGHDHMYERLRPQQGITYFVEGSSGQLRKGGIKASELTASGFADDQTFVLAEIIGDEMSFQAISRAGLLIDSGTIRRRFDNETR